MKSHLHSIQPPIDTLKRTFRDLGQLEQDLKDEIHYTEHELAVRRASLESVRNEKATIGRTIALA
jgi:hypothetical protein